MMTFVQQLGALSFLCPWVGQEHLARALASSETGEEGSFHDIGLGEHAFQLRTLQDSRQFKQWQDWLIQSRSRLVVKGEADYPSQLLPWPQAPLVLWFRGETAWKGREHFAVVGSRYPMSDSLKWMDWQLPPFLEESKSIVVSGGARGVDQKAHWLAIESQCPTLALMPVGLMSRYPPSFFELEDAILAGGGAIISPFAPNLPLYRANFVRRNAVIAAFSRLLLVVEARIKSGSMLTAKWALDFDRHVATLPISPAQATGRGNLDLIRNGATLIRDAADLKVAWGYP